MAAETVVLINPRKRRKAVKRRASSRKRRTAAQRAATRKLVALMKRRRAGSSARRRKSASKSFKRNPTMKRRSRRRAFRRNPISLSKPMNMLKPAFTGAAGALAVNGLVNHLPIPDNLKAGRMMYVTRGVIAAALGMFGGKIPFIGRYAPEMAKGAMTVVLADLGKDIALSNGVNLSGVGYYNPGFIASGRMPGGASIARTMGRTGQYLPRSGAARGAVVQLPTRPAQRMAQYVGR